VTPSPLNASSFAAAPGRPAAERLRFPLGARRGRRAAAACLAAAWLAGCAWGRAGSEERYRIFFLRPGAELHAALTSAGPEVLTATLEPSLAVRQALAELEAQGFHLASLEPLPWGRGAVLLRFRSDRAAGSRPPEAPLDFTGLYVAQTEASTVPMYYLFVPRRSQYWVHVMDAGRAWTITAAWDGRRLTWAAEGWSYEVIPSTGSRALTLRAVPEAEGAPQAPQAVVLNPVPAPSPASDGAAREARRYLVRLRPARLGL